MSISITPSKRVDIDLSNAEEGELLAVTLENGQVLFLSWHIPENDWRGPHFTFDERWLPQDLVDRCEEVARQIAGKTSSREAYEARPDTSKDLLSFLAQELRRKIHISARDTSFHTGDRRYNEAHDLDVTLTPYACLREPGPDNAYRLGWSAEWMAAAPIKRIRVATEYDAELYKVKTLAHK
jgi:hypothetical protein